MREGDRPAVPLLSPDAVIERLERAIGPEPERLVAFDADGTIWDVDVGVTIFEALLDRGDVRSEAAEALVKDARRFNIPLPPGAGAMEAARALHQAFFDGRYPDDLAYAMNAWAFAGHTEAEADAIALEVLEKLRVAERIRPAFSRLIEWASKTGVDAYVVSASPVWIIRAGAGLLGLSADRGIAMAPAVRDGVIEPRIEGPICYGDGKLAKIRSTRPGAVLLGAFGDSVWDAAMLRAARVPVAVAPSEKLLEMAGSIPNLVVMDAFL
ncbi:MAG: haloacid dehalogenase-like hydrolase [Polyangiaceae bacterium]|nr:haloacid dehalogenase-like hydrolase [Polyangiaceae bacterium]